MLNGVLFDMSDTLIKIVYSKVKKGEVEYLALPGITDLLAEIRPHFKLAIVSNTLTWRREDICLKLGPTGVLPYFDYVVTSVDVGADKPLSPIFEDALLNLGLEKHEVVMVGDRLDTDILGAKRLGIRAILLDWDLKHSASEAQDSGPDLVVRSADELKTVLLALKGMKNE